MITLYGDLREQFGETINCIVHSVPELIKAADANRPGFKDSIKTDCNYAILRGKDFKTAVALEEIELAMIFDDTDWHVMPSPEAHSGIQKILVGAAIIGLVALVPGSWGVAPGLITAGYATGAGLIIGGISSYLIPVPKYKGSDSADEQPSYIYDGPTTRTTPGGAITLLYGDDFFVGCTLVSMGLEIGDIA